MSIKMLLLALILFIGTTFAHNIQLEDLWNMYKMKHNKHYSDGKEDIYRRALWEDSVAFVQRHNLEYDMGMHTYTVGINEYADLSFEEYKKYLLGAKRSMNVANASGVFYAKPKANYPDEVDWRSKNIVTKIKNQGQCGSCWAFSSTGALEGQHAKKTGKLVSLSEQNLVDCVKTNAGCGGGWMNNAFKYVVLNDGIDKEVDYPYEAKNDVCRYREDERGADAVNYMNVDQNEDALKAAVATIGPISVAIDATHKSFMLYKSGIYTEPECSSTDTDHAVLVIGYGTKQGQDYWLVKNSWGTTWGMDGYIMMARNKDNMCAIALYASYPVE